MERRWVPLLLLLLLLGLPGPGRGSLELELGRRHVCAAEDSLPPALVCCPGWKQVGPECPLALCLGAEACREREICVRPAVCRCQPGFFRANCSARCPEQFWGPDCRQNCHCHPRGRCHPSSGECSCHQGWWGPLCQSACLYGRRGHCHPVTGTCKCDPGWWAPDCQRQCQCNLLGSRCDPATGRCLCHLGWWGRQCASLCSCNGSPCAQESGRCECTAGRWGSACQHLCQCVHGLCTPQDGHCTCDAGYRGPSCTEACPEGTYGPQCAHSCGHCRNQEPCSPTQGACLACDPGWNGTHCRQPCPLGLYGENCTQQCPRHCLQRETCQPQTGRCRNCEAGFMGARCEALCPPGFFGEGCRSSCPDCFHGSCDPGSGTCLCQPDYWGTSCNLTCPEAFHGPDCSVACPCVWGPCHPISGVCPWQVQGWGALLAGILGPLLLLFLLGLFCCCHCCRGAASVLRAPRAERDFFPPVKHRLMAGLPSLPSSLPCFSRGGSKLPRVTVGHRDPEIPFNPSFIEPPSTAWPWDSSFRSSSEGAKEETGGCQEGPPSAPSPSEALLEGSLLLGEAASHPSLFAIPRTSSLAKGKQPSVSLAEGTHFGPWTPRASPEALDPARKPTASQNSVQGAPPLQANHPMGASCHSPGRSCYENVAPAPGEDSGWAPAGHHPGSSQHLAQRAPPPEAATVEACIHEPSITIIYVTVGQARRGSEEPPPAAQKHQGSGQETARPRSLQKLPWKALDAAKSTSRKLAPEKNPSTSEAQGLLAPDEQVDGGGSSGSLELLTPPPRGTQLGKQTCPTSGLAAGAQLCPAACHKQGGGEQSIQGSCMEEANAALPKKGVGP